MKTAISGFTLIELMVTVAVLGILVAIAVPSYRAFVLNSRMTAQANEFLTAINFARSEAIKRNANVTLNAKAGGWANGWTVDAGGVTLRDHSALEGDSSLTAGGAATITFFSNGRASAAATFNLCNPDTSIAPGRNIEITVSGRAKTSKPGTCS